MEGPAQNDGAADPARGGRRTRKRATREPGQDPLSASYTSARLERSGVDLVADEQDEEEEREDGRKCRERGDAQRLAVLDPVSCVCDQFAHPPVA